MKILERIISKESLGADFLRLVVCGILFTHGYYRLTHGEVSGLAGVLKEQGVPLPLGMAYLVTAMETFGTPLLAARLLVLPIGIFLAAVLTTGIMMFNRHNGFFVVGAGGGGWEYNALLISCLLVTLWENRFRKWR